MRRALTAVVLAAAAVVAGAPAAGADEAVAVTAPAAGSVVTGTVSVAASAPSDTMSVVFSWARPGGDSTVIGADANPLDGWSARWRTHPLDGPATVRATATSGAGESSAEVAVTLVNAPRLSLAVSRARFSPNRDGRRDTTTIVARVDEPASLVVRVVDSAGSVRRTWKTALAAPGEYRVAWDGTAGGRRVADGRYTVRSTARDAAGYATVRSRAVVVDTRAPRIAWTSVSPDPSDGSSRQRFAFAVSDADWVFDGRLRVGGALGAVGSRAYSLSSRTGSVSWTPSRALYPGTYRARVRLMDRAGNVGRSRLKPWRVHRALTGRVRLRLPDTGRRVALTFDDCHDSAAWRSILDVLRAKKAKASFFCPGTMLESRGWLARRTVREGHSIGSHGWDHANLAGRSDDFVRSRLLRDRAAWWRYGRATSAPYFRPPYGAYDARVVRVAGETSMPRVVMWDVDPHDWRRPGASVITQRVLRDAHSGSIVVLHTLPQTARALPRIIDGLRARSLRPVNLDVLYAAAFD